MSAYNKHIVKYNKLDNSSFFLHSKLFQIYKKYKELADNYDKVMFGGRLAEYKYYDMHQVVGSALRKVDRWLN